jgi:hypothetical protein
MANILFSQLTKANTADNLSFITTNNSNNTDFQIEYPTFLNSLRRDILGSEIVDKQIQNYTSEELAAIETLVCNAESFNDGMDINIDVNNSTVKPFVVSFIKDASYNSVRINFTNETMKLNGSRVGFYAENFYDLMLPHEGVRFLFYGNNVMVLDRVGWSNFATEHLSNAPVQGGFMLDGATTFDLSQWRRLNWITSGTAGARDDLPYFLNDNVIIDLRGCFPRYDSARKKLERQPESLPNIKGDSGIETGKSGVVSPPFYTIEEKSTRYTVNFVDTPVMGSGFDASLSSSAYGRRNEVAPNNYATRLYITL